MITFIVLTSLPWLSSPEPDPSEPGDVTTGQTQVAMS
jgi:hypothetical protein